jgi:hypothetical protein
VLRLVVHMLDCLLHYMPILEGDTTLIYLERLTLYTSGTSLLGGLTLRSSAPWILPMKLGVLLPWEPRLPSSVRAHSC